MKTYRGYNNTKLAPIPGWDTTDREQSVEIFDEENRFCFFIQFGENPTVSVFKGDDKDLDYMVAELKV